MSPSINGKNICSGLPPFFIAEIGKNFIQTKEDKTVDEYISNSKMLIKAAFDSGADAVKFQTHNVEDEQLNLVISSPHFSGTNRYEWVRRNTDATPLRFWFEIQNYCKKLGITFFSTPMSRGAAKILENLDVPLWKVGSGDILDFVMLDYISRTNKPIIVSSGMSTIKEVEIAVTFLKKRVKDLYLLYCVSKYPCNLEDFDFNKIGFFKNKFDLPIGFSDHSISIDSSVIASNLGAVIIEKHFTLNRDYWGSDHKVSMLPHEFKTMVDRIRHGIKADNLIIKKNISENDEFVFRPIFRKSLVAARNIAAGEKLTSDLIYAMRPQQFAGGLPSENFEGIIDKRVKIGLNKYDPITYEVLD